MWAMAGPLTVPGLLAISLLVVILLLLVQSVRLARRQREMSVVTDALLKQEPLVSLGRMMAGVAHELNTPLGAVCCSVDTRQKAVTMIDEAVGALAEDSGDTEAQLARIHKALNALHRTDPVLGEALERTNALIRELRLAGRGESVQPEPVDVNALLQSTLILMQHELRHGVEVKLELGDILPVPGWTGPLGQVFLNLILNARQAMGEQGTITITTAMVDNQVVVKVLDDGPGLPACCVDRLFAPGFTTKSSEDGTGLGLFISTKLVQRHEGRLKARNIESGGAEFTVILPTQRSAQGTVES